MMPALPVEAKAATAAVTARPTPTPSGIQSNSTLAALATGVKSLWKATGSRTHIITATPMQYTVVATEIDRSMPKGITRSGFSTSSETLETLVRPA